MKEINLPGCKAEYFCHKGTVDKTRVLISQGDNSFLLETKIQDKPGFKKFDIEIFPIPPEDLAHMRSNWDD